MFQFLLRLVHLLVQLRDLQGDQAFCIVALREVQCGFILRLFHLEKGFTTVENRHVQDDADIEQTAPLLVETVAHVAVCHHIAAGEGELWHHIGTGHRDFLFVDLRGEVQAADFGAVGVHLLHIGRNAGGVGGANFVSCLVHKDDFAVQWQPYLFAKQHFAKTKSIGGFRQHHVSLVHFHFDGERIGFGRNALLHSNFHIRLHLMEQGVVIFSELPFGGDGDHLPVGLIDLEGGCTGLLLVLCLCQILG